MAAFCCVVWNIRMATWWMALPCVSMPCCKPTPLARLVNLTTGLEVDPSGTKRIPCCCNLAPVWNLAPSTARHALA